jgi:uncharacterized membrane protein YdjX (TVP38/TMEM64 family)
LAEVGPGEEVPVIAEPRNECETLARRATLRRFVPLAIVLAAMVAVFATGAYRAVSLEMLVRHRMTIDAFIAAHALGALAAFVALYVVAVALSIPCALFLTIAGGVLFGALAGGIAAMIGSTLGATVLFLVARNACGETLIRRAGPLGCKLADGFRADAFSYLLFLRLVPAFPFFLVNIVPALVGVKLSTFVLATMLGIVPATFAFAFFGSGLDSILAGQESAFRACLESGRADCALYFDLGMILTPRLIAGLVVLGLIALIPVAVKRLKRMRAPVQSRPAPLS